MPTLRPACGAGRVGLLPGTRPRAGSQVALGVLRFRTAPVGSGTGRAAAAAVRSALLESFIRELSELR